MDLQKYCLLLALQQLAIGYFHMTDQSTQNWFTKTFHYQVGAAACTFPTVIIQESLILG